MIDILVPYWGTAVAGFSAIIFAFFVYLKGQCQELVVAFRDVQRQRDALARKIISWDHKSSEVELSVCEKIESDISNRKMLINELCVLVFENPFVKVYGMPDADPPTDCMSNKIDWLAKVHWNVINQLSKRTDSNKSEKASRLLELTNPSDFQEWLELASELERIKRESTQNNSQTGFLINVIKWAVGVLVMLVVAVIMGRHGLLLLGLAVALSSVVVFVNLIFKTLDECGVEGTVRSDSASTTHGLAVLRKRVTAWLSIAIFSYLCFLVWLPDRMAKEEVTDDPARAWLRKEVCLLLDCSDSEKSGDTGSGFGSAQQNEGKTPLRSTGFGGVSDSASPEQRPDTGEISLARQSALGLWRALGSPRGGAEGPAAKEKSAGAQLAPRKISANQAEQPATEEVK